MPRSDPTFHRGYGLCGNAHKTQSGLVTASGRRSGDTAAQLTRKHGIIVATYARL